MSSQPATRDDDGDLLTDGFVARRAELMRCVQEGVERRVAAQLAAGYPVFSSGLRDEADRLFMRTPDGVLHEYRMCADGTREVVRDLS
jgi:hypothetical protein